ncbi:hypothetical protein HYH02_000856 [Chlamydomonas schloesseri]|uniref:Uncharacterized protein n=1 Tax=Chlamydomonas schloesseri TaxID=2026947 RepID=A0A836BD43_9CHLO|nr:hypothetical protein HYH02_000856 [Chlamydomonas schloesseri]|eukprot:KAG2455031.1 hypothetical protein HYH02_000856 [Chlamydomonas schloesseri]
MVGWQVPAAWSARALNRATSFQRVLPASASALGDSAGGRGSPSSPTCRRGQVLHSLVSSTSNAAAAGAGADGGAVETGGASGGPDVLEPAADPEGGTPGGYRRLFWVPITAASGRRFCDWQR